MKKIPANATVADIVGYSLKSLKPVPMLDGLLNQINTLPGARYSPPVYSWATIGNEVYLTFENPASYPNLIFMPMKGGYWDGYMYDMSIPKPPTSQTNVNIPGLKLGALGAAAIALILILR